MEQKKLLRSQRDRMVAGVCGGLGTYFNIDATLVRLVFVLATVFGGWGLIVYLALWLVTPEEPLQAPPPPPAPQPPAAPAAEEETE